MESIGKMKSAMESINEFNNEKIKKEFTNGTLSCGEIKKLAADIVILFVEKYQQIRNNITDIDVSKFTDKNRKIKL